MAYYKKNVLGRTICLVNFCWSSPAVILGSESRGTHDCVLLSHDSGSRAILLGRTSQSQSVRLGVRPLEDHDQKFFLQLNPCGHSSYVISSMRRR
jgi:hypothetical protein